MRTIKVVRKFCGCSFTPKEPPRNEERRKKIVFITKTVNINCEKNSNNLHLFHRKKIIVRYRQTSKNIGKKFNEF